VLWNALGGISWAIVIGLIAYYLGHSAGNAIETFGLYGLAAVLAAILSGLFLHRRHRRRRRVGGAADAAARHRNEPEDRPGE
jgi:drug/metabolite transporter (DMT)-like permease